MFRFICSVLYYLLLQCLALSWYNNIILKFFFLPPVFVIWLAQYWLSGTLRRVHYCRLIVVVVIVTAAAAGTRHGRGRFVIPARARQSLAPSPSPSPSPIVHIPCTVITIVVTVFHCTPRPSRRDRGAAAAVQTQLQRRATDFRYRCRLGPAGLPTLPLHCRTPPRRRFQIRRRRPAINNCCVTFVSYFSSGHFYRCDFLSLNPVIEGHRTHAYTYIPIGY